MRILAIEREPPTPARADYSGLLHDEAAGLWDLHKRGVIRELWFTAGDRRAILMLECASASEARFHLSALPLVEKGLVEFTVLELRSYDGFERLFAGPNPAPVRTKPEEPPEY